MISENFRKFPVAADGLIMKLATACKPGRIDLRSRSRAQARRCGNSHRCPKMSQNVRSRPAGYEIRRHKCSRKTSPHQFATMIPIVMTRDRQTIRSVTVYCSSSSNLAPDFMSAAAELGREIAANHWRLVYGGNDVGMMGVLAGAVRAAGGRVVGVTPQLFMDKGVADQACDELHVTACMRERKATMEKHGDAFIALPGGLGTFEEIFEIICGKILGYHNKPIVLLNIEGYYDPLLVMIEHGVEQHFIKPRAKELYFAADRVADAIAHLRSYVAPAPAERTYETTRSSAVE